MTATFSPQIKQRFGAGYIFGGSGTEPLDKSRGLYLGLWNLF